MPFPDLTGGLNIAYLNNGLVRNLFGSDLTNFYEGNGINRNTVRNAAINSGGTGVFNTVGELLGVDTQSEMSRLESAGAHYVFENFNTFDSNNNGLLTDEELAQGLVAIQNQHNRIAESNR